MKIVDKCACELCESVRAGRPTLRSETKKKQIVFWAHAKEKSDYIKLSIKLSNSCLIYRQWPARKGTNET